MILYKISNQQKKTKLIEKLVKNSVNILKDRESILVIVFILLTFVILAVLPNNLKLSLGILTYNLLYLSKREDKLEMIVTVLIIVIGGMIKNQVSFIFQI